MLKVYKKVKRVVLKKELLGKNLYMIVRQVNHMLHVVVFTKGFLQKVAEKVQFSISAYHSPPGVWEGDYRPERGLY